MKTYLFLLLALIVASILVACGAPPPPAVKEVAGPIAVVEPQPIPAPVEVVVPKVVKAKKFDHEKAAYAKAKRNAALAQCLRAAADWNGDLYVKYGVVANGKLELVPGIRAKEVSRAQCAKEKRATPT